MTRTDSIVVGTLVALLATVTGLIAGTGLEPATAEPTPRPSPFVPSTPRPYREGVLGRPVSINPFATRSQADRDLVALVFSGLVRNGPDGALVPDLAERWTIDPAGRVWTFHLRDDGAWHDGTPVTAHDVAYTIATLQDPSYEGPGGASWDGVEVTVSGARTVSFTLADPLGGFLQAATQAIAPAHLLETVPVDALRDHPFGRRPVGSGPFELVSLDDDLAVLAPAGGVDREAAEASDALRSAEPPATDSLTTPRPTVRPGHLRPYLAGIEFRYADDPAELVQRYRAGELDAVSGLPPALAADLASGPDSRLLRYPTTTLTVVVLDLRPAHVEFRDARVRAGLLRGIDRHGLVDDVFAGLATRATIPIPPTSPWYDPASADTAPGDYDRRAALSALKTAGWTRVDGRWRLPKAKKPLAFELISPDKASNPTAFATAAAIAEDWTRLGLAVTHVPLTPAVFAGERLARGEFAAAVLDITLGLDPDLYPLLASSQTLTGGSNVAGVQDAALDTLLVAARAPGTEEARRTAYVALQAQLAKGTYVLPIAFADAPIVVRDSVSGPVVRGLADRADRFWDVLTWRLADDR